jgi:putative transposase
VVSPQRRRQQLPLVRQRGLSCRRACVLLSVSRSMAGYEPRLPSRDEERLATITRVAQQHPRYGYRRTWVVLRRRGVRGNHKRVYRLWREHGLSLRVRHSRRRAGPPSPRPPEATRPHEMWAYDFVHDRCANGEALKCRIVVDEYTRMCLAIEVGGRLDARRVIAVLTRLIQAHGAPVYLRSDNGPGFAANAIKAWLSISPIGPASIEPGKPWQNGAAESFIGKFRDECLNMEWFHSRKEAQVIIESYRRQYNEERPHSSLAYRTPAEASAGRRLPPAAKGPEAIDHPSQSAGLTLPVVQ